MTGALKVYSGRNRPDLAPVYRLFEQLTDTTVEVEKVYHWDVEGRVFDERVDPQGEILLTDSQLALQLVQEPGVFEPYAALVARAYAEWLHAPDYSWLSFTAWPRVAMINWRVLGDRSARWPTRWGSDAGRRRKYRDRWRFFRMADPRPSSGEVFDRGTNN